MTEQYGADPPRTPEASADTITNPPAIRPTELSPAEIKSCPQGGAMDGAKRLAEIETKLKRMLGKAELNHKQLRYQAALIREREAIINPGWLEEFERTRSF